MAACDCSPSLQRPGAVVSVNVYLGAGGGRRLSFRANEQAGVAALKSALAARVGIPASRLLLLHQNRVLSDSDTLADHRVGDGCELKLLPRLSTGRECGCNVSGTQSSKAFQADAVADHLLDAVNSLHPDEVDRFIQGQASLTVRQTMDDGRGLVVQLCLQSPLHASCTAQGTEVRQDLRHSNSVANVSNEMQPLVAGPLPTACNVPAVASTAVSLPLAVTSGVGQGSLGSAPGALPGATLVAAEATSMTIAAAVPAGHRDPWMERSRLGAEFFTSECLGRAPFRELHGQSGRLLVPSNSVGCGDTILEEMKRTGSQHNDAVAGSFSGSVCMHQIDNETNIDKKKGIILAILKDITRVSRCVQDNSRRGVVRLAETTEAKDAVPVSSGQATVDDEATRQKLLHIRQQMAVRRNRRRSRTQFRLMPYS